MSATKMLEGHWVEGALNGVVRSTGRTVDHVFFSEDGRVVQEVITYPPGYGELNLQPGRYEGRICRPGITSRDDMGRVRHYTGPILVEEDFAYSSEELRERLERRGIPILPEFEEVMV